MPTLFHPATIRWGHRIIVLAALAGSLLLTASLAGAANDAEDNLARATFAGGCFWCMEPPYDDLDGVVETISGFSGGHVSNPAYADVVRGGTGHREVVQVVFDPDVIDYAELLHGCCTSSGEISTRSMMAASSATAAMPTVPPSSPTAMSRKTRHASRSKGWSSRGVSTKPS